MKKIATLCFPIGLDTIYLADKKIGFGAGYLNGWGGKANEGENVAIAACREFLEEGTVTIIPKNIRIVAILDFFEEEKHLFECHVFFLEKWEGSIQETEEMGPPQVFPLSNIPFDRMWKGDKLWLPLLCEGKSIRAKVVYKKEMKEIQSFEWKLLG